MLLPADLEAHAGRAVLEEPGVLVYQVIRVIRVDLLVQLIPAVHRHLADLEAHAGRAVLEDPGVLVYQVIRVDRVIRVDLLVQLIPAVHRHLADRTD